MKRNLITSSPPIGPSSQYHLLHDLWESTLCSGYSNGSENSQVPRHLLHHQYTVKYRAWAFIESYFGGVATWTVNDWMETQVSILTDLRLKLYFFLFHLFIYLNLLLLSLVTCQSKLCLALDVSSCCKVWRFRREALLSSWGTLLTLLLVMTVNHRVTMASPVSASPRPQILIPGACEDMWAGKRHCRCN